MTAQVLEVIAAEKEQAPILANLLELYAHDFSEFLDLELGEDGRFGYSALPLYWSEPDRHPFLIRIDGKLAGLVLVREREGGVWDMAEFFVVRGWRRCGMGTQAAHQVWKRFPGIWEVRVVQANVSGLRFWAKAIAAFTGEAIQPVPTDQAGEQQWRFSFESPGRVV